MEIEAATPPQTTQQYVLARLRRAILTGALPPGSPIRQDALAERFGVSRVPLREALKILEGNGQVIYRPRRGYVVAELSFDDLLEVYRLRELLESEAARQAVGRMGEDDVRRLAEAHEDVVAAGKQGDVTAMATANRRFHFTLIDACGMPRLRRFLGILWDATDVYRTLYYSEATNRDRVEREHDGIVRAVRARDADLLVRLLDEHRAGTVATFRGFLGEQKQET
ncbi:GntR family transcriptional regulator [Spongiactinospora sp. 9N601]|uniref:GntR family transcriptional regulator n=1 Tax=Spongiactinospora sp. 9N601 TaxID=3375149 RepID=UPI0037AF02D2